MGKPIVHGPGFSTYVRTVRLSLAEKGVAYDLNEFDFLQGMPQEQLDRHPFGKVPAFEHDGFRLYETFAICRYVDEAFEGPALQPGDAKARARMTQIFGVLDSYAYTPIITNLVIQRLVVPKMGGEPDEAAIRGAIPNAERVLGVVEDFLGDNVYLAGNDLTLADLCLIPMYTYLTATAESEAILAKTPKLRGWWERVRERPSVGDTEPQLG